MSGKTNSTKKTVSGKENVEESTEDLNTEQTTSEESGNTSGQKESEQVVQSDTNFAQMYDMLTERDNTIKELQTQVASLKKENTNLLLKVNASAGTGEEMKNPYEKFVDSMVKR